MKGLVIRLDSGVTVVPVRNEGSGYWQCVVVRSSHDSYPVGGYDISVHLEELVRGEVVQL